MKKIFASFFLFTFSFLPNLVISDVVGDAINATQTLKDGDTLVSANGTFELGFFSPGSSSLKYLSIRYNQLPDKTIAWVANRRVGIDNSSGVLRLSENGTLFLNNGKNQTSVWSSNITRAARDPVAQLLDTGNLVVREMNDSDSGNYLWQSFDYLGDTLIPGATFGINKKTGLDSFILNWKTSDDPSPGNYTYGFDITGLPQLVLKDNSVVRFRSGPWNGLQFSGAPEFKSNSLADVTFVSNDDEVHLVIHVFNSSTITKMDVNPQGVIQWYIWTGTNWYLNVAALMDACDYYGTCGTYSMCDNNNSPICSCLNGFQPENQRQWDLGNGTTGCVRKTELDCSSDGFQKISGVKVPDTKNIWANSTVNTDECRRLCLSNCSCTAYANLDIRNGGSGCLQWFGDLTDMRSFPESEQTIFIRLAASDIAATNGRNSTSKTVGIAVGVSLSVAVLIIGLVVGYMSPEYAIEGLYSIKSDVFSYGVLVLEIVSGMRNRGFIHPDHHHNLLGHAWTLFIEDKPLDLISENTRETWNPTEVLRSIHIGLLCVQQSPDDRPTLSSVVLMLGGEGQLPQPKQPGFFTERDVVESDFSPSSQIPFLADNDDTFTILQPR
ncbi:hypothetical protein ACFE04_012886 [Oxalis oulophora]